jgi:hypothetical protein
MIASQSGIARSLPWIDVPAAGLVCSQFLKGKTPGFRSRWPRQTANCGDNADDPERIRGATFRREGGTFVIGMEKPMTRVGYGILLIAMALQGLTPDCSNLASSMLLRLVSSGLAESRAADGCTPLPIPRGDQDGIPGEVCGEASDRDATRVRLDADGRPCVRFLPVGLLDQLSRSAPLSSLLTSVVLRWPDGLNAPFCRFLC